MDKCILCKSSKKDTVQYGEFLQNKRFGVHTFCLYLSSNLRQNGKDDEGFLGFLDADIKKEVGRISLLKCCYCSERYANIGCCETKCRHTFHLICGIEHNAENRFCGDFRSYCHKHARKIRERPAPDETCLICYESLCAAGKNFNRVKMILTPCCRNGWFHKACLQKFAQTAGYFFKCPLCNDANTFRDKLPAKGIFIPNQDAAWELEPNAFAELLERPNECGSQQCKNKKGRKANTTNDPLVLCTTCGSSAIHTKCFNDDGKKFVCADCTVALEEGDSGRESPNFHANITEDEYIDVCGVSDNEDLVLCSMAIGGNNKVAEKKRDSGTQTDGSDENEIPPTGRKCNKTRRIMDTSTDSEDVVKPVVIKQHRFYFETESEDSEVPQGSKTACRNARTVDKTYSSDETSEEIKLRCKRNRNLFSNSSESSEYEECDLERKKYPERSNASGREKDDDVKSSHLVLRNCRNGTTQLTNCNNVTAHNYSSIEEDIIMLRRKRKAFNVITDSDDELLSAKQKVADHEAFTRITKNDANDNNCLEKHSLTKIRHLSEKKHEKNAKNISRNEAKAAERDLSKETIEKSKYNNLKSPPHSTKQDNSLDIACIAKRTRLKTITNSSSSSKKERKEIFNSICGQIGFSENTVGETVQESKENFKNVSDSDVACEQKYKNLNNIIEEDEKERSNTFESWKSETTYRLPELKNNNYDTYHSPKARSRQSAGDISSASSEIEIETSPLRTPKSSSQFSNIKNTPIACSSSLLDNCSRNNSPFHPIQLSKGIFEKDDNVGDIPNSHVDSEDESIYVCISSSEEEKTSNAYTVCASAVKPTYANSNSESKNVCNRTRSQTETSKNTFDDEEINTKNIVKSRKFRSESESSETTENEGFKGFISPDIFQDSDSENEEDGQVTTSQLLFKSIRNETTETQSNKKEYIYNNSSNEDEFTSKSRKGKGFNVPISSDYDDSENMSITTIESDKNYDFLQEQSNIRIRRSNKDEITNKSNLPICSYHDDLGNMSIVTIESDKNDHFLPDQNNIRTRRSNKDKILNKSTERKVFNVPNCSDDDGSENISIITIESDKNYDFLQAQNNIRTRRSNKDEILNKSTERKVFNVPNCSDDDGSENISIITIESDKNYDFLQAQNNIRTRRSNKDEIINKSRKRKIFNVPICSDYDDSENMSIITIESDKNDDFLKEQNNIVTRRSNPLNKSKENKIHKEQVYRKENSLDISCIAQRTRRKTIAKSCNNINSKKKKKCNPMDASCISLRTRRKTTCCEQTDYSKKSRREKSQVYEKNFKSKDDLAILITDSAHDSKQKDVNLNNSTVKDDVAATCTRSRNSLKSKTQIPPEIYENSSTVLMNSSTHCDRRISSDSSMEFDATPSALPKLTPRFSNIKNKPNSCSSLRLEKCPQQKITAFLTPIYTKRNHLIKEIIHIKSYIPNPHRID